MTTYTSDSFFDWFSGLTTNVDIFQSGTSHLIGIAMIIIIAILISPRKLSNVKVMTLPLMVGFNIIGIRIPLIYMAIAGIIFIMETLSLKQIGETISTAIQKMSETSKNTVYTFGKEGREDKRTTKKEKQQAKDKRRISLEEGRIEIGKGKIKGKIPFKKGEIKVFKEKDFAMSPLIDKDYNRNSREIRNILKETNSRRRNEKMESLNFKKMVETFVKQGFTKEQSTAMTMEYLGIEKKNKNYEVKD